MPSDVSMVDDSLLQHDLDVVVEEEREEKYGHWCTLPSSTGPHASKGDTHVGELQGQGP